MVFKGLRNFLEYWYLQYTLNTAVYMLEPTEVKINKIPVISIIALIFNLFNKLHSVKTRPEAENIILEEFKGDDISLRSYKVSPEDKRGILRLKRNISASLILLWLLSLGQKDKPLLSNIYSSSEMFLLDSILVATIAIFLYSAYVFLPGHAVMMMHFFENFFNSDTDSSQIKVP